MVPPYKFDTNETAPEGVTAMRALKYCDFCMTKMLIVVLGPHKRYAHARIVYGRVWYVRQSPALRRSIVTVQRPHVSVRGRQILMFYP